MTLNNNEQLLLEALLATREDEAMRWSGICNALEHHIQLTKRIKLVLPPWTELQYITEMWPKYSGNLLFPIPASDSDIGEQRIRNAVTAFKIVPFSAFWDTSTEYGKLRWELLEFCITWLEAKQAELN